MNSTFLIVLIAAFISFILPAIAYSFTSKKRGRFNNDDSKNTSMFIPLAVPLFAVTSVLYYTIYDHKDFLTVLTSAELIIPFVSAIIIGFTGTIFKNNKFVFPIVLFLGSFASSFAIPDAATTFVINLNPLAVKALIGVIWFLFSLMYRYANIGDALLSIQSITIAGGIAILGLIGAIPAFLGTLGIIFTAGFLALMSFTWYPARLKISNNEASCFGFMLFSLIAWASTENAAGCVLIFCLYFIIDILWALLLKLSFMDKYSNMQQNASYCKAMELGMVPNLIANYVIRIQVLLLFLGVFQALADNHFSLLLASSLITIWFMYRLQNISNGPQSFKDINRQVLDDLQARINDIKQYSNKDNNF
ncbi:MAG: hypothetical protein IJZ59_05645 [Alphaproteobacteria bacterium]|nr:hypothetical protein [Alphaproteobacteria bacterium]